MVYCLKPLDCTPTHTPCFLSTSLTLGSVSWDWQSQHIKGSISDNSDSSFLFYSWGSWIVSKEWTSNWNFMPWQIWGRATLRLESSSPALKFYFMGSHLLSVLLTGEICWNIKLIGFLSNLPDCLRMIWAQACDSVAYTLNCLVFTRYFVNWSIPGRPRCPSPTSAATFFLNSCP